MIDYHDYLASPWWTARKAVIIRFRGYRCQRCGVEPNFGLELHHRTYERFGHEDPDDLELLCGRCHEGEPSTIEAIQRARRTDVSGAPSDWAWRYGEDQWERIF